MLEVKWTYEIVRELSKQFDSRTKFCKAYKGAYDKANKKGWLKDFYWLNDYMKNNPNCNQLKYTYNYCFSVAKKYFYKKDFRLNEQICYEKSRLKGFLDKFTWLKEEKLRPLTYIEYEKYLNSLNNEYISIIKNSVHQEKIKKKRPEYTYDMFMNEAKKHSYRQQFRNANHPLFQAGKSRGWLEDCTWFRTPIEKYCNGGLDSKINTVYAYEDITNKVVYVGRTNNLTIRHNSHKHVVHDTNKLDSVGDYFINKLGIEIPQPKVLEDKITAVKSQEQEHYWLCKYKEEGWTILNKGKTGKNIGSLGAYHRKWTYQTVMETCLKVTNKSEIPGGCRDYIRQHNLQDCIWYQMIPRKNFTRTKEECYQVAKKYKYFEDFKTLDLKVYNYARNHKFISDYHWLEHKNTPKNFYNYETVYKIAKTCKTYTELQKKSRRASYIARDNNWLKDYIWFERPKSNTGPKRLRN